MTRPRLLVVASTYPARPGDGTPGFVRDLAREQLAEFDVRVLVPSVPDAPGREDDDGLSVRRYRYWFPRRWERLADGAILENLRARPLRALQIPALMAAQAWALAREVRRFRPDVLHAHWIIPQGLVARVVARRVPTVVTTLGGDLYALNAAPLRAAKRRVVRAARAVTVMNADMRDRVIELGADPDSSHVVPMGHTVTPGGPRRPKAGGVTTVLAVGRLVEKKGFDVLLDALRSVKGEWRLVVVGDGPERAALAAQAKGLPVEFRGQLGRDELFEAYGEADIACFPSVPAASGDQDGLPVAMLEAMASGAAIVASDLPGLAEAIEDGASGLTVPAGDAGALATAIRRLLDDAALRTRLGDAARDRSADFSVQKAGARYRALLAEVAGIK